MLFSPPFCPLSYYSFSTSLFPIEENPPCLPLTMCPVSLSLYYLSREFCFIFARALSEKICFRPPHDENTNSILEKWYFATGRSNKLAFFESFFTKIRTSFICADGFHNIRKAYFLWFLSIKMLFPSLKLHTNPNNTFWKLTLACERGDFGRLPFSWEAYKNFA